MMAEGVEHCLLHHRPELVEEVAALLNKEWPRSLTARILSLREGSDELPCSLLLISVGEGRVVGHARLWKVVEHEDAALVETVMVSPELRGRGLGRRLMELTEEHARRLGYVRLYLSTHDQHGFYQRLGYCEGSAVSALRRCLLLSQKHALQDPGSSEHCGSLTYRITETATTAPCTAPPPTTPSPPLPLPPSPPPPPPPPPLSNRQLSDDSLSIVWYVKQLL